MVNVRNRRAWPPRVSPRAERHALWAIYLGLAAICIGTAGYLHHRAFEPPATPSQAYAIAFTQDASAVVSLKADVIPNEPWLDSVTVSATTQGKPVRWLLAIQCSLTAAKSPHQGVLYSEAAQAPPPPEPIMIYSGVRPSMPLRLGCFLPPSKVNLLNPADSSASASIANVTLPALETDPGIATAQAAPTVYETRVNPNDPIELLQVFPTCPSPTASQADPAATTTPSTAPSTPSTAPSTPSTSPSTTPSAGPGCLGNLPAGTGYSTYHMPAAVRTQEVLEDVNLSGYQTESVFPVPEIAPGAGATAENDSVYTWNGLSSLSPSLDVSNLSAQTASNKYAFASGVFYGVGAGAGVAFFGEAWGQYVKAHPSQKSEENKSETPEATQAATAAEESDAPGNAGRSRARKRGSLRTQR